jgi:Papain-like cysteine protease AvrRpt2
MAYSIANVPLIPQTQNMACWYASAQMLIEWRRIRTRMCEIAHPYPSEVPQLEAIFAANNGLPFGRTVELAKDLGLTPVAPMTPTPMAIESWLRTNGPLWFAGLFPSGHAVVITGITAGGDIQINDPWPPNAGRRRSLSFVQFGATIQPLYGNTGLAPNLLYFNN